METFELILTALLLLIAQGFTTWYFAYKKKQGEYRAIKKNIAQVTRATEGIKKELDLIAENEISFRAERRNTIIKYFESIDLLHNYLTLQMEIHNGGDVSAKFFNEHYPPFSILTSKLDLLVESKEVTNLSVEIGTLFNKIVQSATNCGIEISDLRTGGGKEENIIAVMKRHQEYLSSTQKSFLDLRYKLMLRFREILKQDYPDK